MLEKSHAATRGGGGRVALGDGITIAQLRAILKGRLIAPGDAAYDATRTVFVGGIDRRPAIIVRAADATDVSRLTGSSGMDQVFGNPTTWGLGYSVGGLGTAQDSMTVFGVGGVGGSFACGGTATGIAFAVTKNRLAMDFSTATQLSDIVRKSLARG